MSELKAEVTQGRPLTFGEKAVGLTFNPGGSMVVNTIKTLYAAVIDELDVARKAAESHEAKRMYSVAITEAQTSQMWAVKAATWKD
jgi:hypothetical protein